MIVSGFDGSPWILGGVIVGVTAGVAGCGVTVGDLCGDVTHGTFQGVLVGVLVGVTVGFAGCGVTVGVLSGDVIHGTFQGLVGVLVSVTVGFVGCGVTVGVLCGGVNIGVVGGKGRNNLPPQMMFRLRSVS